MLSALFPPLVPFFFLFTRRGAADSMFTNCMRLLNSRNEAGMLLAFKCEFHIFVLKSNMHRMLTVKILLN